MKKMPKPKTTSSKGGFRTPFSGAVKKSGRGSSRGGRGR